MNLLWTCAILFTLQGALATERCCTGVPCFSNDPPFQHLPLPECPSELDIELQLNTRSNPDEHELITKDSIPPAFESNKRTVLVIHGWMESAFTSWLTEFKDALLDEIDVNVITVRWKSTDLWYPQSAANTRSVGGAIYTVVRRLAEDLGYDAKDVYCIGHSLGAQTCGMLGKLVKIGRISGLDPAGPLFEGRDVSTHLNRDDADLVDVYHTNIRAVLTIAPGFSYPMGHIDFYPNKGTKMPGCILDPLYSNTVHGSLKLACSHMRVLDYFKESITNKKCRFSSNQKCTDHKKLPGSCYKCSNDPLRPCQVMGYNAEKYSGRGIFYLETNSKAPFCKGI